MAAWAFLFPGQGSQYVGMGKDLRENFTIARQTFEEADEALKFHLARLCLDGPESDLKLTENTQPAILTVSIAVMRVVAAETGITPSLLAGHSLGEYACLVTAGALSFIDAVKTVRLRGRFMQEAVPVGVGAMAAILGLERGQVEQLCSESAEGQVLAPANYNCPGQIVIAGEKNAVEEAIDFCKQSGAKRAVPLSVSVPSHCKLMGGASGRLAELLDKTDLKKPVIPLVNNADAAFLHTIEEVKSSLIRQLSSPLLWEDSIKAMVSSGTETFVEVGPGRVLSGLIKRIDPTVNILNVEDLKSLDNVLKENNIN